MKTKRKRIGMLAFIVMIAVLMIVTMQTPGTIADAENYQCQTYATVFALLPPVIAIGLALITKEVYTSLLAGIIAGGLLYSNFNLELMLNTIFYQGEGGMVMKLSDSWNVGILVFLVMLGILVALLNKAGGSAAFGEWTTKHIKTRVGAQIAVIALGVMIFVDDYFNCLTVGSVMRPVTDRHQVSRAKLAYIIDATAAPVCIIAPISSWAAAVTSSVPEEAGINGFSVFIQTIPYNLYAILTLCMLLAVTILKVDFGPMKKHEMNAFKGDLFTTPGRPYESDEEAISNDKAHVMDLVLPVAVLIVSCIVAMIYTGGFFDGASFVDAFADSDASVGLVLGGSVALVFTFIYFMMRDVLSFKEFTDCIPEGCTNSDIVHGMDFVRHDKSSGSQDFCGRVGGRFRFIYAGISSDDHLPCGSFSGFCNRYIMGHIQYSHSDCYRRLPGRTDDGNFYRVLSGRCRMR